MNTNIKQDGELYKCGKVIAEPKELIRIVNQKRKEEGIMRVLKVQDKWLRMILSGKKTMEVRSQNFNIVGLKIGLGNSKTRSVEGYATVIAKIPQIGKQLSKGSF